ncbi:MAG: hypothetical protein NUV59_00575, partial [Patescibacteria group bacterium]|nr:hypothetical protein [Patescibacteria group bacterium]
MRVKILTLNCQKGYRPEVADFLEKIIDSGVYDFLLLQEYAGDVPLHIRGAGPYRVLGAHDSEVGEQSHFAILYRDVFTLRKSEMYSFSHMHPKEI